MKTDPARSSFNAAFPPTPHGLPRRWVRAAGGLVLASLTLQHGFPIESEMAWWLNWLDAGLALWLTADMLLACRKPGSPKAVIVQRLFEFVLLGCVVALMLIGWVLPAAALRRIHEFLHLTAPEELAFNLIKIFVLLLVWVQMLRGAQRLFGRGVRPEIVLASSFISLILVGAFFLWLPNSSAKPNAPITFMEAFFTSVSAACVTGLGVRDTGSDFSTFGQMVIMALFQIGGLGIITFVAFLSVFSTRTLPVPQMVTFRQLINAPAASDLKQQLLGILAATVVIELIGAILLYQFLEGESDPLRRLRWSLFHSVSAFCNAGFGLQADNLSGFNNNPGLMLTIMGLIVLGGLGFLTIPELLAHRWTRAPFFRRFAFFRRLHSGHPPGKLSLQTKLSLHLTVILILGGLFGFWALEFTNTLSQKSVGESFVISAFQSVTTRTAGFNSVNIADLRDTTLLFMMMLMVIGASPVSMGGGIKTVSFGILLLALRAMVTRRERVEAFGRTVPGRTLFAALSVFIIYILTSGLCIFLLALFDPQFTLQQQAFEVISALSTVGLSTGITAQLSVPSQLVLCAAMFVGRVGPISLVLSVFQSKRVLAYEFPEEEVVVG